MPERITYAEAAARLGIPDQGAHAGEAAPAGVAEVVLAKLAADVAAILS